MKTALIWKWQPQDRTPQALARRLDLTLTEALAGGLGEWEGTLGEKPPEVSRSRIQKLLEEGRVLADGVAVKSGSKLKTAAARLEIRFPAPEPLELVPEERELEILFEDEHLVVLNKPPGLTVHPSSTQRAGTLVHALLYHISDLSGIGGKLRPGIVHRIDKDTSGALVITKTDLAHRKLAEVFARHDIERVYWALCYGAPAREEGLIEGLIGRNPTDRKKMAVLKPGSKSGRKASSSFRKLMEFGDFASWLEVRLKTGRTHQIRVHLTSIGHSLLGDPVYGTPTKNHLKLKSLPREVREAVLAMPGQALHARVLGFTHPITGEKLRFEATPPPAFSALLEALRRHA